MKTYILGMTDRQLVCYFHFVGWSCLSLGFHVCFAAPNIEIHVPFGFFRLGWQGVYKWRPLPTFGKDRVNS